MSIFFPHVKLTEELRDDIIQRLEERVGSDLLCPLCRKDRLIMMVDFFLAPLQPDSSKLNFASGKGILCAVMVCHNCGNTVFINLVALGVPKIQEEREMMERRKAEQAKKEALDEEAVSRK